MTNTRFALLTTVAALAFENNGQYQVTPEDINDVRAARQRAQTNVDPMLTRSKDSAYMVEYWDLTDTIVDGINALRVEGKAYLPKFADETNDDYKYRLRCTKLTNVYRDTVENLASKPFEQEVTLETDEEKTVPPEIETFIEDVDGSGNNITVFAGATFFNGINSAIDWIFVDAPPVDPAIRTVADAKAAGLRPYWSHVLGRNVFDVKSKVINGEETLTYMRIYEPGEPDRIRIFKREETGQVRWCLFEKTANEHDIDREWLPDNLTDTRKTRFIAIDEGVITIGIIPLVPFTTGRRDGRSWKFFPAMRDAADLQIELYQQESGLKYAKNLTAYPMLAANGIRPQMEADGKTIKKVRVGPSRVLYGPPDASGVVGNWSYVEPNAQSLKFLADDIKETIAQLRELGRQPLTAQSGNLTVITTAVAATKAKSAVGAWALQLKDALENALVLTCKFKGVNTDTYDPTVYVFTEFDEFIDGKDTDTLNTARGNGDISQKTYWHELKRRRILSDEFDDETEENRLLDEVPNEGADDLDDPDDPNAPKPGDKPASKPQM